MKPAVVALLACFLLLGVQAQPANRSNKCKCSSSLLSRVNLQSVQAEPVIYQPSAFCPRTEIIVTLGDKEKCVDPKSRVGQLILKLKNRSRKSGGVHVTTASAQTSSAQTSSFSSTTQQRTSRL